MYSPGGENPNQNPVKGHFTASIIGTGRVKNANFLTLVAYGVQGRGIVAVDSDEDAVGEAGGPGTGAGNGRRRNAGAVGTGRVGYTGSPVFQHDMSHPERAGNVGLDGTVYRIHPAAVRRLYDENRGRRIARIYLNSQKNRGGERRGNEEDVNKTYIPGEVHTTQL